VLDFVADASADSSTAKEDALKKLGPIVAAALVPAICWINFRRVSGLPKSKNSSSSPVPYSIGRSPSNSSAIVYLIASTFREGGAKFVCYESNSG